MINAGAILVCSLLKSLIKPEMTLAEKFDFTMNYFKRLAGEENLGFNNAVFLSEREAADRNYALGFYMREHNCYPDKTNLREIMDFYFQVNFHSRHNKKFTENKITRIKNDLLQVLFHGSKLRHHVSDGSDFGQRWNLSYHRGKSFKTR